MAYKYMKEKIKEARKYLKLSEENFANLMGITRYRLRLYEKGEDFPSTTHLNTLEINTKISISFSHTNFLCIKICPFSKKDLYVLGIKWLTPTMLLQTFIYEKMCDYILINKKLNIYVPLDSNNVHIKILDVVYKYHFETKYFIQYEYFREPHIHSKYRLPKRLNEIIRKKLYYKKLRI